MAFNGSSHQLASAERAAVGTLHAQESALAAKRMGAAIVARNIDPMDTAVVSTTQIHSGDTWNVIPQECVLRGTVRTFKKPVQDMIEQKIEKIARNVAAGFGAEVTKWRYERRYPATVNTEQETEFAALAAAAVVIVQRICDQLEPR